MSYSIHSRRTTGRITVDRTGRSILHARVHPRPAHVNIATRRSAATSACRCSPGLPPGCWLVPMLTILYRRATISPSDARYTFSPSSRNACRFPFSRTAVPKNFRLIGGGGGGPVGTGGAAAAAAPGRALGTFFGITIGGGAEIAEKILRPVPEYTRLSVRNIADSSSVGSRLDDVLAIIFAAIPGAVAWPSANCSQEPQSSPSPRRYGSTAAPPSRSPVPASPQGSARRQRNCCRHTPRRPAAAPQRWSSR